MQDDLAMVLPQTCAGLYNDALVASRPKGDIRIRIRPLTRLGERPGSIVPQERWMRDGLEIFMISGW
jgi:hypothetical protein